MKSDLKPLFNLSVFEDEVEQEWSWGFKSLKAFIQYLRKENYRIFSEFESEAIRELLVLDPEGRTTLIYEFNRERAETLKSHLARHILETMPYMPAYIFLVEEQGLAPRELSREKGVRELRRTGVLR